MNPRLLHFALVLATTPCLSAEDPPVEEAASTPPMPVDEPAAEAPA